MSLGFSSPEAGPVKGLTGGEKLAFEEEREPENSFEVDDFLPSEKKCFEVLRDLRWSEGVYCPRCGSERTAEHGFSSKFLIWNIFLL